MITDIQIVSTPDLSVNNEVMNFTQTCLPENAYSGATWLISGHSAYDSLLIVFKFFWIIVNQKLPSHDIWLLVGNSIAQPDTRITRYRRLWGSLKARGLEVLDDGSTLEAVQELGGKLQFFGAKQLSKAEIDIAVKVCLEERCSYFAVLPRNIVPQKIVSDGWSTAIDQDSKLIAEVATLNGVLIKPIGSFDDIQKGIFGVGTPKIMETILN